MFPCFAALRELFKANAGNSFSGEFSSVEMTRDIGLLQSENGDIKMEDKNSEELIKIQDKTEDEPENALSVTSSLMGLHDAADEFFDVLEPSSDDEHLENDWPTDLSTELCYPVLTTHHT